MQGALDCRAKALITCGLAAIVVFLVWKHRRSSSSSRSSKKDETKDAVEKSNNVAASTTKNLNNCRKATSQDEEKESETSECETTTNDEEIPELPYPRWIKVGRVEELYFYPLKSGRGKDVKNCNFTEDGISVVCPGRFTLRDRMFLVYNEETGRFQTGRKYPTLILVSLSAVDEFKVRLEAVGMPSVVFRVPENSKTGTEAVVCTMWWGEPIKCIDCGHEAAEWISRFLTGTSSGLRLAYATEDGRNILKSPWERHAKVYNTLRSEDAGLFADLTSYMLMSSQSLDRLNKKLDKPVPIIQFRPNIVVSTEEPFAEDNWEWIKIGESAVIRNVKPCPRCKMVQVDPETGTADREEPLKTLKTFREQKDPERVAVDGTSPLMGIYCGLYATGKVSIGDDVFVHVPDDSMEISYHQISPMDDG